MTTWQLPEGIDELSGTDAAQFESLRRQLIDLYTQKGYELVIPPMVENTDSLLLTSDEVDKKTFKFLDPVSGKMLGVHADITPQIARIDAKRNSDSIEKYCYVNAILQTKADDFYSSRSPIQAGAELYGSNNVSSDVEVINLMLQSLDVLGASSVVLSLGNVSIFNQLLEQESLSQDQLSKIRQIFQKRSTPDLSVFLDKNPMKNPDLFSQLMHLEGDSSTLSKALDTFKDFSEIINAIEDLAKIADALDTPNIVIDLAELKTYQYHTGVVFSAYSSGYSKALAQGGRYNGLGASFGQSRAATGFSFDLKFLSQTINN